jgi:hypothetical protein
LTRVGGQDGRVLVTIRGHHLPGREFCRPDGSTMDNVHVAIQVRGDPWQPIRADRRQTAWTVDIDVVDHDGVRDFRGPAVHGRRGERFLYLTWGHVPPDGSFEMFRRAKLVLDRIDPGVLDTAVATGSLTARVDLTGGDGGPRCARVDPPAIEWSTSA